MSGTVEAGAARSAALGEDLTYQVYLPPGYAAGGGRHPVLYLLHGRGDTMRAWSPVFGALDDLIRDGILPPVIAVMPDAPWSRRGNWYVDSAYTGAGNPGRPVESALVGDLVPAVDEAYRTAPDRAARLIGGYSMGGAGALRLALAHQRLFGHALVLSPAAYVPLPAARSNTRVFGAFGLGERRFDEATYRRLNYPALLPSVDPALPLHLFIAAGEGEYGAPAPASPTDPAAARTGDPTGGRHDIGTEHEVLYEAVRRVPGIHASARVLPGGHDWGTWLPAFVEGMTVLGSGLRAAARSAANPPAERPEKGQP